MDVMTSEEEGGLKAEEEVGMRKRELKRTEYERVVHRKRNGTRGRVQRKGWSR